jgi:molecular chaperone DnaJ
MGLSDADAQIKVDVPRGIEDGEILRFRGSGNDGLSDSAAGDLYLMISVDEHPALKRRGLDIYSEVKLPASRFREGGPLEVFTIAGTRKISLPPFTTPERIFQLKGLGVTRNVGDFTESGDHFVRITEFRADVIEAAGQAPRNGLLNGAASSR